MASLAIFTRIRRSVFLVPTFAWIEYVAPPSSPGIEGGEQEPPHDSGWKRPWRPPVSVTLPRPNGFPPLCALKSATKHAFAPPQSGAAASPIEYSRRLPTPLGYSAS